MQRRPNARRLGAWADYLVLRMYTGLGGARLLIGCRTECRTLSGCTLSARFTTLLLPIFFSHLPIHRALCPAAQVHRRLLSLAGAQVGPPASSAAVARGAAAHGRTVLGGGQRGVRGRRVGRGY